MNKPEILAPAGSMDSLKAAIHAFADAVYVGGKMFGARAFANNLSQEELFEAIDYVHLHGRRIYLTVNTLVKNKELEEELYDYLLPFYEHGLDAVIVQDMGVLSFIHSRFPDLAIHASTQMAITGVDGAILLKELGVTRVVTARELSLKEIRSIKDAAGIEVESFVHGALCYSYSGQCLMSSMIGGRSGNRGRCAQTCRLPYDLYEGGQRISQDEKYLLSPKDMNAISLIPELIHAGIDSFKIEGRMKKPEYVAAVVGMYRKYLDQYWANKTAPFKVDEADQKQLLELYNRGGFTSGYYEKHNGKEMMSMERPNHMGIQVGTIGRMKDNTISFQTKEEIHKQDVLEIKLNEENSVELTSPEDVKKGQWITLNASQIKKLKIGQIIYRTRNKYFIDKIRKDVIDIQLKEKVKGIVTLKKGFPATINLYYESIHITYEGEIVGSAIKQPLTIEKVIEQLKKTGNTAFEFEELDVSLEEDCFLPVLGLKNLRRESLLLLEEKIINQYRRQSKSYTDDIRSVEVEDEVDQRQLVVSIMDLCYLDLVLCFPEVSAVYVDASIVAFDQMEEISHKVHEAGKRIYFILPHIFRQEARQDYMDHLDLLKNGSWDGYIIRSLEEVSFCIHELEDKKECILDYQVYNYNQRTIDFYNQLFKSPISYTFPVELNYKELMELNFTSSEMIVYGYIPLMVSAQCLVKNTIACKGHTVMTELKDRFSKSFYVKNNCRYCYNSIYNGQPIYYLENEKEINGLKPNRLRIHLLRESISEAKHIIKEFIEVYCKETKTNKKGSVKQYTRGHLKRGIE